MDQQCLNEEVVTSSPQKVTLKLDEIGGNNNFSTLEIDLSYIIV